MSLLGTISRAIEDNTALILSMHASFPLLSKIHCVPILAEEQLKDIDGLIIPGGESSTMSTLIEAQNLSKALLNIIQAGLPVLATCAGCILLARQVQVKGEMQKPSPLALLDMHLERNSYGRQAHSFYARAECVDSSLQEQGIQSIRGLFIRAPRVLNAGKHTQALFTYKESSVVLRHKNILLCTFHPEAVEEITLHLLFLQSCAEYKKT